MRKLTTIDKIKVWLKWAGVKLLHFFVAVFGFPLLLFAFLLKYGFDVKGLWLLNDTKDGDFGGFQWKLQKLRKFPIKNRLIIKIYLAVLWYLRNSVWNLKNLTAPKWTAEYTIIKIVKNEVGNPWRWVNQADRGTNFIYKEVAGQLQFMYSHSNDVFNCQFGMISRKENARYNFKFRRSK